VVHLFQRFFLIDQTKPRVRLSTQQPSKEKKQKTLKTTNYLIETLFIQNYIYGKQKNNRKLKKISLTTKAKILVILIRLLDVGSD
jgi:hypothetical protein